MLELQCFIAAAVCTVLLVFQGSPMLSPDGMYYQTRPWLRPYCMRRLLYLDRWSFQRVREHSVVFLSLSIFLVGLAAKTPWAAVAFAGLPMVRTLAWFPVLSDAPALFVFALGLYTGNPMLMALGGLVNEKVPVFGALALWSAVPLIGLAVPMVLYLVGDPPLPSDPEWLRRPFKAAWRTRARLWDPMRVVVPWGAFLLGIPAMGLREIVTIVVAYAQCLVAQDTTRIYQWGFCALLPGMAAQPGLLPMFALLQWALPWKRML